MFPKAQVEHLDFSKSDHRPILVRLEEVQRNESRKKNKPFCFEPFWLKEEKDNMEVMGSR